MWGTRNMCLILVHTLKTPFERQIKECAANLTLRLPVGKLFKNFTTESKCNK